MATLARRPSTKKKSSKDADSAFVDELQRHRALRIVAMIAIIFLAGWVLVALLAPGPAYHLAGQPSLPIDSEQFVRELASITDGQLAAGTRFEVFTNGENYYRAEMDAMRQAQRSINLEAYIFAKGKVAGQVMTILADRARQGVKVHLTVDAMGSATTPKKYFAPLRTAGGKFAWYHPLRWNNWFRSNNRTHRELLVVDGTTAFVGGAGYADHWMYPEGKHPRWRDTMVRIEGPAVPFLQGAFTENWLEAANELLDGSEYFHFPSPAGRNTALVVNSSPSAGGSTYARVLIQMLVAAAQKTVFITSPYFLPDKSLRQELQNALERGVKVIILLPGKSDHMITRASSRGLYGDLLKAGAEIHEYQPGMIHAKILLVDGVWSVFGSTNFDNRSFGLNDEVNVAALDPVLNARLTQDFGNDLAQSELITLEKWKHRPYWERGLEWIGWMVSRQQ